MGVYIKGMTLDEAKWLLGPTRENEIIEVKTPHGRLIDADREIKMITEIIESNSLTENAWNEYDSCRRILKTAPTVIEAEVE